MFFFTAVDSHDVLDIVNSLGQRIHELLDIDGRVVEPLTVLFEEMGSLLVCHSVHLGVFIKSIYLC